MKKISCLSFLLFLSLNLFAQEALKSVEEEYYDFLSLQGLVERPTLNYRTLSDSEWILNESEHIWKNNNLGKKYTFLDKNSPEDNWALRGIDKSLKLKIYGPDWFNSFNTASPYGQNDGALWQGKGYNTSLTAGARLEAYGFEVTVKPQISFMQNLEFEYLPGVYGSKYSYFYNEGGGIDFVQRYGDTSFWQFDLGDTEIRYTWHNLTIGFGNQSPWIGPAYLNPMLGSNNAASYTKFDIGLRKTKIIIPKINFYLGDIEVRLWVGKLKESEYFNDNGKVDDTMLHALSISYSPSFIPGFTIGANRIINFNWNKDKVFQFYRLFNFSNTNVQNPDDAEDQKISVSIDWTFPKIGFEFYGELGLDDFTSQKKSNPFHTAIYTVGIKQKIPLFKKLEDKNFGLLLNFEWNNFEMSQDFQMQWRYQGYYSHGLVNRGYTNKGQILGAGTGYFGNSQFVQLSLFYPRGKTSLIFHRHCPNNNYIYNKSVGTSINDKSEEYKQYYGIFETYFNYGINQSFFITKSLFMQFNFSYIYKIHSNYQSNNDINSFKLDFIIKYQL